MTSRTAISCQWFVTPDGSRMLQAAPSEGKSEEAARRLGAGRKIAMVRSRGQRFERNKSDLTLTDCCALMSFGAAVRARGEPLPETGRLLSGTAGCFAAKAIGILYDR